MGGVYGGDIDTTPKAGGQSEFSNQMFSGDGILDSQVGWRYCKMLGGPAVQPVQSFNQCHSWCKQQLPLQ